MQSGQKREILERRFPRLRLNHLYVKLFIAYSSQYQELSDKPFRFIDFSEKLLIRLKTSGLYPEKSPKTHLVLSAAHAFRPGGLSSVTNN
jgi:hypothetical protein